ncbi:hypothetical protein RUM43_005881 [Polyplax serrata]|uniref:RRM domain-containing protein n=1 Tax=Polyplax serrata TaxID=468196 RepID=A0AAN8NWU6_POLSC
MSFANFPQAQAMNPPPPPPLGLTVMTPTGPQLPGAQFEQAQLQMMTNPGQPPLPGQQAAIHQLHQMQQQMQQMQHLMHPALNDAPLEFNINKNKPPIPILSEEQNKATGSSTNDEMQSSKRDDRLNERRDHRDRDHRDRDRDRDRRSDRRNRIDRDRDRDDPKDRRDDPSKVGPPKLGIDVSTSSIQNPNAPQNSTGGVLPNAVQMMGVSPMIGMMGGMMGHPVMPMMGGMIGDPAMLSMTGMGQYGMMPGMMSDGSVLPVGDSNAGMNIINQSLGNMVPGQKGIIEYKECTLIPPSPNAPPPVTRERPPGCKTVYIGGIPENCTEEIIRDVFGRCGEMQTIRLSKKNFCHIRFVYESSVDSAIFLSGYRMRIGNSTDAPNTGRLHVDYAQARDDQYEYECRQRAVQREQRHRERMERERMRPVSPPPVPHYSDHEAATICEKIKSDEGFQKSVQMVVAWLERGDCSKRNANTFYSMIQSTNSHVRRLMNEKMQYEEELQNAKDLYRTRVQGIIVQLSEKDLVLPEVENQQVVTEMKQMQFGENLNEEADEEMDVSDNDDDFGGPRKKCRNEKDVEIGLLKDENESLRCQLEAYKNEVDLVRGDMKNDLESKEKQLKMLQQTVQNLQKQLLDSKRRHAEDDVKLRGLQARIKSCALKKQENGDKDESFIEIIEKDEEFTVKEENEAPICENGQFGQIGTQTDRDARLIGLISTFLHVHPFGAGVDYIWSFLTKLDPAIKLTDVEALLNRFPSVFRQELSGIGATMERRWVFIGFEPI